jgi:selenide,water dikinase
VRINEQIDSAQREILWDPQTSGGLFAAIDPALWPTLAALAPKVQFWQIGEATEQVEHEAEVLLEVY